MTHDGLVTILVAVIGGLALIIAAGVTVTIPFLLSIRRNTKATHDQVTNDHDTNLRVESDQRHLENKRGLASLRRLVLRQGKQVNNRIDDLVDRLELVEDTIPRTRRKP